MRIYVYRYKGVCVSRGWMTKQQMAFGFFWSVQIFLNHWSIFFCLQSLAHGGEFSFVEQRLINTLNSAINLRFPVGEERQAKNNKPVLLKLLWDPPRVGAIRLACPWLWAPSLRSVFPVEAELYGIISQKLGAHPLLGLDFSSKIYWLLGLSFFHWYVT